MKKGIAIILMAMLIAIPCIAGCTGLVGEPIVGKWDIQGSTYTFTSDGKYTADHVWKYTTNSYGSVAGSWKITDRGEEEIRYTLYDENGHQEDMIYYVPKTDTIHYVGENNQYHRIK